jgi:hypothetical protein
MGPAKSSTGKDVITMLTILTRRRMRQIAASFALLSIAACGAVGSAVAAAPAPAPLASPVVSGTATEGQSLKATAGQWSNKPTSYNYQWYSCEGQGGCLEVRGATSTSHTLTSSDTGYTMRVLVTASNAGGSSEEISDATKTVAAKPVSAPSNTTAPTISGTTTEAQMLTATNGGWTNSPTGYTYQWLRCNTAKSECSNISGAISSRHTLSSSDTAHTLRVTVNASNAGGSGSSISAATATIAKAPAAPASTSPPTISGTTTEGQSLTATKGSWTNSPTGYTYQWQRCTPPATGCAAISGATATTYKLTSSDAAHTVRVVVKASNATGSGSATSAVTATIAKLSPPSNMALPIVSGSSTEGQTLSTTTGTWKNSPASYSYQWQRDGTTNISGATSSSYKSLAADLGHKLDVVVTAKNSSGSASAESAQTAAIKQPSVNCFSALSACGYPDPSSGNIGPTKACSSLKASGALTAGTTGEKIENLNITGQVTVTADNVTLTNDCIANNGNAVPGSRTIAIAGGATGTKITYSDISGANSSSQSVEEALSNNYENEGSLADHDYIYNCGECVHGKWTLTNSYVTANASIPSDHYEDIYCNSTTFRAEHDVLLNPHNQTADLFCDTNDGAGGPAENHVTLTKSLLAGGGYSLYLQGNSTSIGSSTMNISQNRFARCLSAEVFEPGSGGTSCKNGADSHGYWPFGGYYGAFDSEAVYCPPASGQTWSANVWDDNNETINC